MKCSRCGIENDTVATHSGVYECAGCWTYRKLDLPAAKHWHEVASAFLSNVDVHDMMTYLPDALRDVDVEYAQMLRVVQAVMVHSKRVIDDGPYHLWESK